MRIPIWFRSAAASILLANAFVYAFHPGGARTLQWASSLLPIGSALAGVAGICLALRALKSWDRTKLAWLLLALGMLLSAAGETAYMILHSCLGIGVDELDTSVADLFWMLSYPPYLMSLMTLILGYRASGFTMGSLRRHLLLAVVGCAVAVALVYFVLLPVVRDPGTGILGKIVYLYYPIGDFILLVPSVLLVAITAQFGKGSLTVPWKLLSIAFLLWAGADLLYSWLSWNDFYHDGDLIDIAWNAAYLLIGAAGLWQRSVIAS